MTRSCPDIVDACEKPEPYHHGWWKWSDTGERRWLCAKSCPHPEHGADTNDAKRMAERLAPQCESDWQGPSDDECVDDLLVIRCEGLPGHNSGGFNTPHLGRHPDDHGLVVWRKGTDCLENYWGGVRQHQFNPCPTHGGADQIGGEGDG